MSYLQQSDIAFNSTMMTRVAQCATEQGIENADEWTAANRRVWAAAPGWDDAWASSLVSHAPGIGGYDPGADESVITDNMILAQVQAMNLGG